VSANAEALPRTARHSRHLLRGADGRKLVAGVVLIAAVLFGQQLYGWATATHRLDPSLRNAAGPSNVIVILDFMPDRFHSERIRDYGLFAGRDGAINRMRLHNVGPENLHRLARIPWVARIEPMK
jgi:hypothetical protein